MPNRLALGKYIHRVHTGPRMSTLLKRLNAAERRKVFQFRQWLLDYADSYISRRYRADNL